MNVQIENIRTQTDKFRQEPWKAVAANVAASAAMLSVALTVVIQMQQQGTK
jgi:hypothetical protein